ncbi:excinuclease ABC subunit UvrC [Fulvivirga sp. M361]|uniref:excinuclease ABC subunit UvrC n=1 Tax=Fulvivirga sp. M361 TaxID=2594266 RepID=UPI00117A77F5|nr:excinuclease ABC subunit UvrC [Fulvivirga sp. M361]TRX53662.1 excinuclease ABC subunit UvrC [Fulvivirga sp. M361]
MKGSRFAIDQRSHLPSDPGIYKFFDKTDTLIYVGKAKNIKKRVASYFTKTYNVNRKTRKLVEEIEQIEFAIANSEFDALLLENNLIKANQPKYNILLKDDKTFPYICILKERFPRIISTRKYDPSNGEYFGPYTSVVAMKSVLDLIRKLYTIRTCKLNLSEKNILNGKFKICLEYHIGNCLGPCENLQQEADYLGEIEQARDILKGNLSVVSRHFTDHMKSAATNMEFELAQRYKEKLDLLTKFQIKSTIVNPKLTDVDVFTIAADDSRLVIINYLRIKNGAIILARTVEVKKQGDESDQDVLSYVAFELRNRHDSDNAIIFSNIKFDLDEELEVMVPKIGDKKKLVALSLKNALEYKKDRISHAAPKKQKNEILIQLQSDLKLTQIPDHIECFDNSNLQGTNPVASMVCFKDGKAAKKEYRHYNIKTVVGPDDFASMKEIVGRRYKRLLEENLALPKLIVIDGGKGQLSSACEALKELSLYGRIPIIGIAKRLEEIYYPEDTYPLHIHKKSSSLMLLQRIRDEAHRFAITFHRTKRSSNTFKTELEEIQGIGVTTADQLLQKFKSIAKVKQASIEELINTVGQTKAQLIFDHLKNKKGG